MAPASVPTITAAARSSLAACGPSLPALRRGRPRHVDDKRPERDDRGRADVGGRGRTWATVNGTVTRSGTAAVDPPVALVENRGQTAGQAGWNNRIAVYNHPAGPPAVREHARMGALW